VTEPSITLTPTFWRLHELQVKAETASLTVAERAELERLQTEWSNYCLSPTEQPKRST
jgi:hypothetical protein